ncbi:MAG: hypothetical protein OEV43_02465 [Coriobacteriia bacterium]|nr:hypothetical protein [Coriobacteriia bacterium]
MPDTHPNKRDERTHAPQAEAAEPIGTLTLRRAYRALLIMAVVGVALAVLVNWIALPNRGKALPSAPVGGGGDIPAPADVTLSKAATEMLPDRVLQYETITHQAVPGQDERSAEAVYKTLSMNMATQIETVVYGRVEGHESASIAEQRLESLVTPYPRDQHQEALGSAMATVAWSEDQGAFVIAWVDGQYTTIVKASFADWVPEWDHEIIEKEGRKVADAVRVFQETGRQGVTK